jgi:hypothetical protein
MTHQQLDALRVAYDITMPSDYIRGCFFSKRQLLDLLNRHDDCSGLFFYVVPDPSKVAKFTMVAEPFDPNKKRYTAEAGARDGEGDEGEEGIPCPPINSCP